MRPLPFQKLVPVNEGPAALIHASSVKSFSTRRLAAAYVAPSNSIAYPAHVDASGRPTSGTSAPPSASAFAPPPPVDPLDPPAPVPPDPEDASAPPAPVEPD